MTKKDKKERKKKRKEIKAENLSYVGSTTIEKEEKKSAGEKLPSQNNTISESPDKAENPKMSENSAIERWKSKLETEAEIEKEMEEELEHHPEIIQKLTPRDIIEDEYIICPNCKQETVIIEGRCSICNFEIKE